MRDPVEMRVDRHQPVEALGDQPPDDPLADCLAGAERDILPHIGEIGRDQHDAARSVGAQRPGGQQQLDQLRVGMIERAIEDRRLRRGRHPDQALAIGEAARFHLMAGNAEFNGQTLRRFPRFFKGKERAGHACNS